MADASDAEGSDVASHLSELSHELDENDNVSRLDDLDGSAASEQGPRL